MSRRPHTFAVLLLLTLILHTSHPDHAANGQSTPSPSPTALPKFVPKNVNLAELHRHFALSSDAPLTSVFTENSTLKASMDNLLRYVEHIDTSVVYATKQTEDTMDSDGKPKGEVPLTTCNHRDDGWGKDIETYFYVRGWQPADRTCISDVYGTGKRDGIFNPEYDAAGEKPPSPEQLFNLVLGHSELVAGNAKKAVEKIGNPAVIANWTKPTRAFNFTHEVRTQKCQYDYTGFVKFGDTWFIAERITNNEKDVVLSVNERNFIYEYIRPGVSPHPMRIRNRETLEFLGGVTTALGSYTGIVTGSAFDVIFPSDNLAVEDALRIGEHQTQQANDATTASNIAILAFPLVMNVVPVALIAEVNSLGMLVYTLLTDVLTAVPLAIKGVEVLTTGRRKNFAAVTRITGANVDADTSEDGEMAIKAAELWVAECHANGNLTVTGVVLLVVALSFMFGGIAAEFWAKHWVTRKGAGKVIDGNWADMPQAPHTGADQGNEFLFEPASSTTIVTAPAAATPPNQTTAALLAGGVRERERFMGAATPPGNGAQAVPLSVPGTGMGTAEPTPPTSLNGQGFGTKSKET